MKRLYKIERVFEVVKEYDIVAESEPDALRLATGEADYTTTIHVETIIKDVQAAPNDD